MHDCFTIELTGECLKCLFRLTGGVPAVVVQSEALWARIPEIQVRIPSRAMGTFFPHTVSSIFRLSLTHTHTHTHVNCFSSLFFFCKDGSDRLMKRASFSCCNFLCVVLAAAYLKYRQCCLSCLPFVWHFFSL